MIKVYGIKNCDTVKKALQWLKENNVEHQLHDYRCDGVDFTWLQQAEAAFGWAALVNKRSTTWRNLSDEVKQNLNRETALQVLMGQPTLIKRPIILQDNIALIGFEATQYANQFNS
ncbi:ArsC family reductase [[Haemophilus] felis]|uniref:ArsC family reductase n=1 Tax=[Haemophilus] felis TaxID=123822 RepID=A0A1T0AY16_9PAST|nr:ArsC family reductase [[Haemophilus] felis]NBI41491.1 ArsC family reductase [[Haemophilus] felis]OOS02692.1 ArsC family reductase [[Haemophilus] felis]